MIFGIGAGKSVVFLLILEGKTQVGVRRGRAADATMRRASGASRAPEMKVISSVDRQELFQASEWTVEMHVARDSGDV